MSEFDWIFRHIEKEEARRSRTACAGEFRRARLVCTEQIAATCESREMHDCPRVAHAHEIGLARDVLDELSRRASRADIPALLLEFVTPRAPDVTDALRMLQQAMMQGARIIVLAGPCGVGKSVAAAWWLFGRLAEGRNGKWTTAQTLVQSSMFDSDLQQRLLGPLVLDDIGAETGDKAGHWGARLDSIVDQHYATKQPMVMTTNLSAADFRERYGVRIWDRIVGVGRYKHIGGESMRRPRLAVVR